MVKKFTVLNIFNEDAPDASGVYGPDRQMVTTALDPSKLKDMDMDIPELRDFYNAVIVPLLPRFFRMKTLLAPTLALVRTDCPKGQHYHRTHLL
jgi:hypothetical protein